MKHPLQSRKTAKLSESVQHRLNQYALVAGVGMLAWTNLAEAKIVYTPAHTKLPVGAIFSLDLNHDGTADFTFYQGGLVYFSNLSVGPAGLANQGNGVIRAYSLWAAALRAGVRVTERGQDSHDRMFMAGWRSKSSYSGPWASDGKGVKNRYLGLKFPIKGKTHFGWARLNVAVPKEHRFTHFKGLLTGYAYETIPNKPIITGKTKGPDVITMPDNVGTLGHLALGRN